VARSYSCGNITSVTYFSIVKNKKPRKGIENADTVKDQDQCRGDGTTIIVYYYFSQLLMMLLINVPHKVNNKGRDEGQQL
jgi:hypothetical protein